MQKILFSWLMAFLAVGFVGCGVGESCDNTQIKDKLVEQIKSSLLKAHPEFSEQIQKTVISLGEITTMKEQKTQGGRKLGCSVKEIKVKLDSGDTLSYKQGSTSFFGIEIPDFFYEVEFTQDEFRLFNLGNIMSFFGSGYKGEIGENLKAYYSGDGLVIDGVRKGGCNGIKQLKDKNGKVLAEYTCTNGLRNGAYKEFDKAGDIVVIGNYTPDGKDGLWKYYKDGLLYKEQNYKNDKLHGKRIDYDKLSGKIEYVWELEEGRLLRTYNKDGNIIYFAQYKNGELERQWLECKWGGCLFFYKVIRNEIDIPAGFDFAYHTSEEASLYNGNNNYREISNGKIIVRRNYSEYIEFSNGKPKTKQYKDFRSSSYFRYIVVPNNKNYKSEQEVLTHIQTLKPMGEEIVIDNLELYLQINSTEYIDVFVVSFSKNNNNIGSIKLWNAKDNTFKNEGLCQQKGKCEEMFKAVIDRSAYKNEIYAYLSGKESSLNSQSSENEPNPAATKEPSPQSEPRTPTNETKAQASAVNEMTNEAQAQSTNANSSQSRVKPSFDCSKASTNAEKLVCSDDELAILDLKLANAYKNARNSADAAGKKKILEEQKIWLKAYNFCNDKDCVKQNLEQRIQALN